MKLQPLGTCCLDRQSRRSLAKPGQADRTKSGKSFVEELRNERRPESIHPEIPGVALLGSSAFPHSTDCHQGSSSLWPLLPYVPCSLSFRVCVWLQPWCGLVAEYAPADAKGSTAFLRREPPLPHPRRSLCLVATVSCGLGLQPTVLWPDGFCMTATSQQGPPLTRARAWHWDSPGDQPQGDPSTRPAVAMNRVSFASGHFGESQKPQQITDLQTPPKRTWELPQAVWQHLPSETCTYQE